MTQIFPDGAYYVELAAHHYRHISNTYALDLRHRWRGLCIEANPEYLQDLARFRTCALFGGVVADSETKMVQFAMRNALSGIVGKEMDNRGQQGPQLLAMPFIDVLRAFAVPNTIDYLSLDVEGAEWMILHEFPFDEYTFLAVSTNQFSLFTRHALISR
jgi:hypothetical protein